MGSILVAFMTAPLTFSLPLMNSFCALALPETSLPKFSSERLSVTVAHVSVRPDLQSEASNSAHHQPSSRLELVLRQRFRSPSSQDAMPSLVLVRSSG